MSTIVILLRTVSVLAFAGPMLLVGASRRVAGPAVGPKRRAPQNRAHRAPLIANLAAFGLFLLSLVVSSGSREAALALPLALTGCLLAVAGASLVVRSRTELGPAWSLVPKAGQSDPSDQNRGGLVTTGPYRLIRHPIYLGLVALATGEALAFGSWAALVVVLLGVVPSFAWRAFAEDKLLKSTLGERYEAYRQRTKMIIPWLL